MLIQGGTVVLADEVKQTDIRIEEGLITGTGTLSPEPGEEAVNASGLLVVPGGIDAHTHLDMPWGDSHTADGFLKGSAAAVAGGTTMVVEFAECADGETPLQALDIWKKKAEGRSLCDYGFHMTISGWNQGTAGELEGLVRAGVASFKAYTAYQDDIGVTDRELYRIMKKAAGIGAVVCVHSENDALLIEKASELENVKTDISYFPLSHPREAEAEAISRVVQFAAITGATVYIVHISTKDGADIVRRAREQGIHVYGETCPHYLLLDDSRYTAAGFEAARYVMAPPLRKKSDQDALWDALCRGSVQTVSTDHCAFRFADQKSAGREDFRRIPAGIPSVEHRIELMYSFGPEHGLSLPQIAALTSGNPAAIFGIPGKGRIDVGMDADLTILDPCFPHVISAGSQVQAVDYTPYEGTLVTVKVRDVYVRGVKKVSGGRLTDKSPAGRYVHRNVIKR